MQTQRSQLDADWYLLNKPQSLPAKSDPRLPFCDVKADEAIGGIPDHGHVHFRGKTL